MVFVVTIEGVKNNKCECDILGIYMTEKEAKVGALESLDGADFKKKLIKKDTEDEKNMLFVENIKENPRCVYLTVVDFQMPESKSSKKKRTKDLNAPKKPKSGYLFFSQDNREKIKTGSSESPLSFGDLGKAIGQAWKALSDKDKVVYNKKAAKDKERYTKEMETYVPTKATAAAVPKTETATKAKASKKEVKEEVECEDDE